MPVITQHLSLSPVPLHDQSPLAVQCVCVFDGRWPVVHRQHCQRPVYLPKEGIIAHICIGKQCACRAMKERGHHRPMFSDGITGLCSLLLLSLSPSLCIFFVAISIPGAAATSAVHSRRLVFRHFLCALRTRRELLLLSVPQVAVCVCCVCVVTTSNRCEALCVFTPPCFPSLYFSLFYSLSLIDSPVCLSSH